MKRIKRLLVAGAVTAALVAVAWPSVGAGRTHSARSTDKLAQILARGTLILSTDPGYPPQSYAIKGAKRLAKTKCAPNQMTANQMGGYDADTGKVVAQRLGVEACFVAPTWSEIISGHWNGRWDIAIEAE